jgi:hypothetical protein
MSSTSSAASVDSVSGLSELACAPSHSARSIPTAEPSSRSTGPTCPATTTSEPLLASPAMSSAADFPAKISQWLAKALGSPEVVLAYGRNTRGSFAIFDLATSLWKTFQRSLVEDLERYSETWPRSGMTQNGIAYQLPTLAPLTGETESGSLPTPSAMSYGTNQGGAAGRVGQIRPSLETMARRNLWPTPRAEGHDAGGADPHKSLYTAVRWNTPSSSHRDLAGGSNSRKAAIANGTYISGMLNPMWVEWLMGFPLGHTDLGVWETQLSRKSRKSSDAQL